MSGLLKRTFHLREGEAGLVFALGFLLVANSLAMQISGIVGVSGILDASGPNGYLLVLGIDYTIVFVIAALQSLIIDRFSRIKLIGWVTFGFVFVFVVVRLLFMIPGLGGFPYTVMYIVAEQQVVAYPLIFWILANDIFSPSQARRLFPVIASLGLVGKLLGQGIMWIYPSMIEWMNIERQEIILFNVLIYLIVYLVIQWRLSNVKVREVGKQSETLKDTFAEAWGFITDVPAFRYLMFSIIALTVCDTIMEFRYYALTHAAWPGDGYIRFLSAYRLITTLLALVTQGFLTARIINAIGIKNTFWFLPVVTVLGTIWMLATPVNMPGVIAAIGAMATLKLVRDNTDASAKKSFQQVVPEERRGRVSTFMDSYLASIGTVLGCVVAGLIIWISGLVGLLTVDFYIYLGVVLAAGLFAIWAIYMVVKTYDTSLFNWRLKRRQRGSSAVDALLATGFRKAVTSEASDDQSEEE